MDEVSIYGNFARWGQVTWPIPEFSTDDQDGLGWRLRYGTPTKEDLVMAATYIHSYNTLIAITHEYRREVVRNLRTALSMKQIAQSFDGDSTK